ncbi:MAG: 50S ribosomal protein L11 methyltransferase [Gammaproteobacteria bacterium]|nr:50S ribosomal protein L11 methyltransferase [Gammaproteobacteria bacterium]
MWQQIQIQTSAQDSATLEQLLLEHGALSISLLDSKDYPIFQRSPGATDLWPLVTLLGLFDLSIDLSGLMEVLRLQASVGNADSLVIELIEEQHWERSWMQDFEAMQFGDNLWICPSWQIPPDPTAVNLMLDPGLAFGSGSHATTALCLRWLAQHAKNQEIQGREVIDFGCGSGVLGIAAALLGARRVHSVDHDPQALTATVNNSQRNHLGSDQLTAYKPDILPPIQVDLILANILAEPLLKLAEQFASQIKAGGLLVLSGILQDQSYTLVSTYSQWFVMEPPVLEEEWVRLVGVRKK